jgi:hypothetical protein
MSFGSRAWVNNRNIERGIGEIEMNADPKHKGGHDDRTATPRRRASLFSSRSNGRKGWTAHRSRIERRRTLSTLQEMVSCVATGPLTLAPSLRKRVERGDFWEEAGMQFGATILFTDYSILPRH